MRLGDIWSKKFLKFAAWGIILLAVYNLNGALALTGKPWALTDIARDAWCSISYCGPGGNAVAATDNPQQAVGNEITISIEPGGYNPKTLSIKAGQPITLHLKNTGGRGCIQAFTIPQLNISKIVPVGSSADIQFTAPAEKGQLAFMCSMGMYRGVINVN